jgi:hypothetical protein
MVMKATLLKVCGLALLACALLPNMARAAEAAPTEADAKVIADQLPTYPLQTCVVSGEKFGGEMGKPVDYVYKGRLVRFCCKGCIKDFLKEPDKYFKKIDDAAAKAKAEKADPKGAPGPTGAQTGPQSGCGGCGR